MDSLNHAAKVLGYGIGILRLPKPPPSIIGDPTIFQMRQAERALREQSIMLARDVRTENLARLQARLSIDA